MVSPLRPLATRLSFALGLTLIGCGWGDPVPADDAPATRPDGPGAKAGPRGKAKAGPRGKAKAGPRGKAKAKADRAPAAPPAPNVGGTPGLVLFLVMDTVRSDHTSLCGYERPTTPFLQTLVDDRDFAHACRAYSPAPWTIPSHASFFTGTSVTEHASMFVAGSEHKVHDTISVRPLSNDYTTMAEAMKAQGYQTVALSANIIVNKASGLMQGFDLHETAGSMYALRGPKMPRTLQKTLKDFDQDKPLFLFINLYDAHDPYPPIPAGVDWAPPQDTTHIDAYTKNLDNPYYAFLQGKMPQEQQVTYLRTLTNGYDWGIQRADDNVRGILDGLAASGWMDEGWRIAITSDHGEFLGEHGKLRHSGFLWEPGVRVPFLYQDSTRTEAPPLAEPFGTINVYSLITEGTLPDPVIPPQTVSEKNPDDLLVGVIGGATWAGDDKALCQDGTKNTFDLSADPTESQPGLIAGHRLEGALDTLCTKVDALHELPPPSGDDELMKMLEAAGYVEGDGE